MKPAEITTKPHYAILDGLRGVAAIMVVIFHIFEAHATSSLTQVINHGYLAVDFFFLLSGFVIGYAYDDRWNKLSVGGFFKRRLVRLQPMVIMGMIVGAALFYFQKSPTFFPLIEKTPVWQMLLIMVIGFTILPVPPSMDIRGWHEMHPLNGPGWSLFFEYIGNILYALFVRKFSNTLLAVCVFICGVALIHLAINNNGQVIGGWSVESPQFRIGFTRMMYPFFAGLLLSRTAKLTKINNAFLWCSLLVIASLSFPRLGGEEHRWWNGLYDSLSIIFLYPLIVYIGASGEVKSKAGKRICKFLGDISYPIYITHYPIIYIYTAWVVDNKMPISYVFSVGLVVLISSITLAWACLKFYDEPVRAWLQRKWLAKPVVREKAEVTN
jgi:peptidoglycan/LPS O-acetylase OafA/YrhL